MSAVWYVSADGAVDLEPPARTLAEERAALRAILDAAAVPAECGDAIPVAPARGPALAFTPRETVMTDNGPRLRNSGWKGRRALRRSDAFDAMRDQAARRAGKAGGVPPFTSAQEAAGRDYAALVERVAAAGLRCSSLEASCGGGGARAVSEAVAQDMRRLAVLRRRIGDGVAKDVLRPSKGGLRGAIRVRALVDAVCVGGMTLAQVARAHGWAADGRVIGVLQRALAAALDRMQGFGLLRPQHMG